MRNSSLLMDTGCSFLSLPARPALSANLSIQFTWDMALCGPVLKSAVDILTFALMNASDDRVACQCLKTPAFSDRGLRGNTREHAHKSTNSHSSRMCEGDQGRAYCVMPQHNLARAQDRPYRGDRSSSFAVHYASTRDVCPAVHLNPFTVFHRVQDAVAKEQKG